MTIAGNAAMHSFTRHAGTCLFIGANDGMVIMYEMLRLFVNHDAFKSSLGGEINSDSKFSSYSQFKLNRAYLMELNKALLDQSMIDKIILDSLSGNYKVNPGVL